MSKEYVFDGEDDYIKVTPIKAIKTDKGFSFTTWFNADRVVQGSSGYPNGNRIFTQNNAPDYTNIFLPGSFDHNITGSSCDHTRIRWQGYNPYPTSGGTFYSNASIFAGSWYHLACTYQPPSGGFIYIDGALDSSGTVMLADNNTANICIGGNFVSSTVVDYPFQGKMKDIRIYEKLLSADDISMIYNNGIGLDINNSGKVLIRGMLEDQDFAAKEQRSDVSLRGRDYGMLLQDITIPPEVYTNEEISEIIIDLMKKYCTWLTYNNVQNTGITLPRQVFNHISLFDALKDLSNYCNYTFYVDNNKDLHFEPRASYNSGYTLDNSNTITAQWKNTRKELANNVWVYGDKQLSTWKEMFNAFPLGSTLYLGSIAPTSGGYIWIYTGSNPTPNGSYYSTGSQATAGSVYNIYSTGSVYTLQYNPSNTQVERLGSVIKGGVAEMSLGSGTQYLVDYQDKNIILVSGVGFGNNVYSNGSIIITYDRSLPIIKYSIDRVSEDYYGPKDKVIIDKSIKDAKQAETVMRNELSILSNPKTEGTLALRSENEYIPGQYVLCNFPNEGIGSKAYDILQVDYKLDKVSLLSDNYLQLKLNQRIKTLTDELTQMKKDLLKIQSGEIDNADLLTRYESFDGSVAPKAHYNIYQRSIGTSFVMGNLNLARIGISAIGSSGLASWALVTSGGDY